MSKLTKKQETFCQMVLQSESISEAYRKAYDTSKMKDTTINRKAFELMENGKITARLNDLKENRNKRLNYDADSYLRELIEMAEADMLDIFNDSGCLRDMSEWPPVWRRMVTNFSKRLIYQTVDGKRTVVGQAHSLKVVDRAKILLLLGKHTSVGAFGTNKHEVESDLARRLTEAIKSRDADLQLRES